MEAFTAYIHESPLFDAYILEHRTETLKITDLMTPKNFERTAFYNEFYRRVEVSNQLVTPMRISDELLITCSINIENKDFSGRDKTVLMLIAPHLANAIRNAFAYQRLSGALETEACGIIALDSHGKPVFISEFARQLFEKYFAGDKHTADGLPEIPSDWIKKINQSVSSNEFAAPSAPLKITDQSGEVTARIALNKQTGERTLMLEEKPFLSPQSFTQLRLTRRESEILFWISQGKIDGDIGQILKISVRRVQKHVENIFKKLGVETRTSAASRISECLK